MNTFIKTAKRLGTSAILLLGACLTAQAQSVAPTPATAAATAGLCVPSTATNYSYTFTGPGTLTGWYALGDFQVVTGQAATANPILVNSLGPGRGRIVAQYNSGGTCPQEKFYQVNKTFAQPINSLFLGPDCVELGKAYGFVLPPIVSTTALIDAKIGIDSYDWDANRPVGTGFPTGSALTFSGDRSAVSLTLPTTFAGSSYELRAKIGGCNPATPYMSKTIYIKPNTVVLSAVAGSPATCKTDNAPFSLSFIAQAGPTYTWNGLPAGWAITSAPNATLANGSYTYAAPGPQTITITPGNPNILAVADISVTAKNGASGVDCTMATSNVFRVTRQLNSTDNPINPVVPGCLTPGSTVTFSFNHAFPLNTVFEWLLPTGWAPSTSTTNSATVIVGSTPGDVTARVLGCTTGGTVRTVAVKGSYACNPADYVITRFGGAMVYFEVTNPAAPTTMPPSVCKPATGAGFTYEWSSTANPNPTHTTVTTPYISFPNPETIGNSVSVIIKNTNAANPCFELTVARPVNRMALGSSSPTAATDPMVAYPNPAGSELHIDLNGKKGTTQLVLTDALGRTVQQVTTTEGHTKLDVRSLPAGTYLLRATLPDGKSVGQPVQIQH